jgi:hypothetical protein
MILFVRSKKIRKTPKMERKQRISRKNDPKDSKNRLEMRVCPFMQSHKQPTRHNMKTVG